MERHRFDRITVAIVPLSGWTVLHAVVAIPYVLEKVDLQSGGISNEDQCMGIQWEEGRKTEEVNQQEVTWGLILIK